MLLINLPTSILEKPVTFTTKTTPAPSPNKFLAIYIFFLFFLLISLFSRPFSNPLSSLFSNILMITAHLPSNFIISFIISFSVKSTFVIFIYFKYISPYYIILSIDSSFTYSIDNKKFLKTTSKPSSKTYLDTHTLSLKYFGNL